MNQLFSNIRISKTFCLLIVIGLTVWAQHSWVPGFFQDGYLYAAFGKNAAEAGYWLIPHLSPATYPEFGQHTPFAFILEGLFFTLFGSSYTSARIFATLFTILTMAVIYFWCKKFEKNLAFLSSFIFIFIPPLIKKTRFPNMDLPLMLWIYLSLYFSFYAIEKNKRYFWIFSGLFFGFAMLTKGPIAFSIPLSLVIYLLFTKKTKILLNIWPWLSLLFGFALFSIWPLSLYCMGRMDIFYDYTKTVFIDTAVLARGQPSPFYTYIKFFITTSLPWFILTIISVYLLIKRKIKIEYKNITVFFISFFFPTLLILSLARFKYSHYLIPLYPAMSILASVSLISLIPMEKVTNFKRIILLPLALALPLFFVIFPVGTEIKRDPEIFKLLELYRQLKNPPDAIGVINDAYPFYALANLMGYHKGPMVFVASLDSVKNIILNKNINQSIKRLEDDTFSGNLNHLHWSFMLRSSELEHLKSELPNFYQKFSIFIYFKKIDLYILVERPSLEDVLLN